MTLSAWAFYVGNIALLTIYLICTALSRRPGGITGRSVSTPFERRCVIVFFALAACLHADMAIHVALRWPFFNPFLPQPIGIAWDFALIVLAKAGVSMAFMVHVARRARRLRKKGEE